MFDSLDRVRLFVSLAEEKFGSISNDASANRARGCIFPLTGIVPPDLVVQSTETGEFNSSELRSNLLRVSVRKVSIKPIRPRKME